MDKRENGGWERLGFIIAMIWIAIFCRTPPDAGLILISFLLALIVAFLDLLIEEIRKLQKIIREEDKDEQDI